MPTPQTKTDADLVRHLQALISPAVLLACRGKKPVRPKWQQLGLADMTPAYLADLAGRNIGVSLGAPSDGLVSVDFDTDESLASFVAANPRLSDTLHTRGRRGGNLWLRITGEVPRSTRLKDSQNRPAGEWRADGNQTVIAGDHPETGSPYQVVRQNRPVRLSVSEICWPPDVQPCNWPGRRLAPRQSDVEGTDNTEHSPALLHDSAALHPSASLQPSVPLHSTSLHSASLHHNGSAEDIIAAIESERRFLDKKSPGEVKLYETLVRSKFKPEAHARNAFITRAVPFLYRAVSDRLVLSFSAQFYASNQAIFGDPPEQHKRETVAMLKSVAATYLSELGPSERRVYESLDAGRKPIFRIARDLARYTGKRTFPPPLFYLSAQNLADRLACGCQQAHRMLQSLVGFGIIRVHEQGVARAAGRRSKATIYRWMLVN